MTTSKRHSRSLNKTEKIVLLFMLIFIQCCIFIPVWQAGESRTLSMAIKTAEADISKLQERKRVLRTQIARAQMPEYLIDQAYAQDVNFQRIAPEHVVMVASAGGR